MSRRVVTTGDGVKLIYEPDKKYKEINRLVKVNIPPRLERKRKEIERNAQKLEEVVFDNKGRQTLKTVTYKKNNKGDYQISSFSYQPLSMFLSGKRALSRKSSKGPMKIPNKPIEINAPGVISTMVSYLPKTKMSIANRIRGGDVCMPQNFMYRAFKPNAGKSYFNYVIARNTKGVRNLAPLPPNYSKMSPTYTTPGGGIVRVAEGTEGVTFMGCMSNDCEEKVLIKASIANQPYRDSKPATEFKINKEIFNKCKDATPHIVMPYVMNICKPEDAFLRLANISNTNVKPTSRLAVGYYEFYNGGSLFSWMKRRAKTFTEKQVKTILFQILWTLGIMYRRVPSFRHNDLHIQNIFIKTGEKISKTGSTSYGKMFRVPNIGIMSAVGDFGWSKTSNKPHPNVNSNEYKNTYGISKETTIRQDTYVFLASLYVFLMEYDKFNDTKRFIEKVLGLKRDEALNGIRLRANRKSIPSPEMMLKNEYFKEFRVKKEQEVAPPPPPPNNNLLRNIKRNIMSTKESDACGKRTAPKQGGIRGMSVEQMIDFIKTKGTPAAKAALSVYKKKPKRGQVCYILTTFRAGRTLVGLSVPPATNNNNNNNNIELIELKAKKPLTNMSKVELMNFIVSKGGNLPNDATMKNLIRMARSMNSPSPRPLAMKTTTINTMNIKGTRVRPAPRERPTIAPASSRLNATEKRLLNILTNRMYNSMANNNKNRNKARTMAKNKMMAIRNRMRQAFGTNTHLNTSMANNIMPPVRKIPPKPVPAMSPKPRVARVVRPVNGAINLYKYTLDNMKNITENKIIAGLRVEGKLVRSLPRSELNKILRRVGYDPKTIKSKAEAAKAIFVKRSKYIKPYKSMKAERANVKKFQDEIDINKKRIENEELKRIEALRNIQRKGAEYKFESSKPKVVKMPPNARAKLFARLGLK